MELRRSSGGREEESNSPSSELTVRAPMASVRQRNRDQKKKKKKKKKRREENKINIYIYIYNLISLIFLRSFPNL
jgi:hypothetical protein